MKAHLRLLPWILALAACATPSTRAPQGSAPVAEIAPELAAKLESLADGV